MTEALLFVTNGDGSVNCAWCEKRFSADDAIPDSNDDPICPQCDEGARSEEAGTKPEVSG